MAHASVARGASQEPILRNESMGLMRADALRAPLERGHRGAQTANSERCLERLAP